MVAILTVIATFLSLPAAAQDARGANSDPVSVEQSRVPTLELSGEYWSLLLTGISLTAGGMVGARLAHLETMRWETMSENTSNRQQQIDRWSVVTVVSSVAVAVGVGIIALWATVRLSQEEPASATR